MVLQMKPGMERVVKKFFLPAVLLFFFMVFFYGIRNHQSANDTIQELSQYIHELHLEQIKRYRQMGSYNEQIPGGPTRKVSNKYINIFNETGANIEADCVRLRILNPGIEDSKICVYETEEDIHVSRSLRKYGVWEGGNLKAFGKTLLSNPALMVLDIGSQLGTFTMYANKIGARVIAVDVLRNNLQHLSKSLHLIHQENNVVLLWNAISNNHDKVILQLEPTNVGGTHVVKETEDTVRPKTANYEVQSIMLDDMVDEFRLDNKSVYIKMDIQGYEWAALQGAYSFFRRVKVCYILMEFVEHTGSISGQHIVEFLKEHGLYPHSDPDFKNSLEGVSYTEFPFDVYFARKDNLCV